MREIILSHVVVAEELKTKPVKQQSGPVIFRALSGREQLGNRAEGMPGAISEDEPVVGYALHARM